MVTAQLKRIPYISATQAEKAFLLYLPQGYERDSIQPWPVLLFLHGNGERGDTLDDLDYLLVLGPLYEAWIQKRDLPFIIIAPQLGLHRRDKDGPDYLTQRTRMDIPLRLEGGIPEHTRDFPAREMGGEMTGAVAAETVPPPHLEIKDRMWDQADPDVIHILDFILEHYRADPQRVYLTGVSLGGYGTWHFASRYPKKFAAILPVVGFGTVEQAKIIAQAGIPVWAFSGGRDLTVQTQYFFPAMKKLDDLGANFRFTTEQDMAHDVWNRTYAREDVYHWLLQYRKT
jgi:predicted peptidase